MLSWWRESCDLQLLENARGKVYSLWVVLGKASPHGQRSEWALKAGETVSRQKGRTGTCQGRGHSTNTDVQGPRTSSTHVSSAEWGSGRDGLSAKGWGTDLISSTVAGPPRRSDQPQVEKDTDSSDRTWNGKWRPATWVGVNVGETQGMPCWHGGHGCGETLGAVYLSSLQCNLSIANCGLLNTALHPDLKPHLTKICRWLVPTPREADNTEEKSESCGTWEFVHKCITLPLREFSESRWDPGIYG